MYIQNYSFRLDFEIMLKTVQILFMKESTEGVGEGGAAALCETAALYESAALDAEDTVKGKTGENEKTAEKRVRGHGAF